MCWEWRALAVHAVQHAVKLAFEAQLQCCVHVDTMGLGCLLVRPMLACATSCAGLWLQGSRPMMFQCPSWGHLNLSLMSIESGSCTSKCFRRLVVYQSPLLVTSQSYPARPDQPEQGLH